MKKRVLIIGAGPTSSLISFNISKYPKLANIVELFVWEKEKDLGGRFTTIENSNTNAKSFANIGAQYLTQSKNYTWSKPYFENLVESKLLTPIDHLTKFTGFKYDNQKVNYSCDNGTKSIVKHFFENGHSANFTFNQNVTGIYLNENQIKVEKNNEPETNELFDAVILTIPVPNILELNRFNQLVKNNTDTDIKLNLTLVKYTSRFALALFYDQNIQLNDDEKEMNFIQDDEGLIVYWSFQNSEKSSSFVIHTSCSFGEKHFNDDPESVQNYLLEKVKEKVKSIPKNISPSFVKCQKWNYSQVKNSYPFKPGYVQFFQEPLLLAAGDGFTFSGIEGCILSSEQTVERLRLILCD